MSDEYEYFFKTLLRTCQNENIVMIVSFLKVPSLPPHQTSDSADAFMHLQ